MKKSNKNEKKQNRKERFRRVIAYLLDWYIGTMFVFLPFTIVLNANELNGNFHIQTLQKISSNEVYVSAIIGILFGVFYYFIIPAVMMKGQTIGKKLCGLKIVGEDDANLSISKLFFRQCIFISVLYIHVFPTAMIAKELLVYGGYTGKMIDYVCYAFLMVSIGMFLFHKSQQTIHDYVVKSKVVYIK